MTTDASPGYVTPRLARWRSRTDGALVALAVGSLPVLLLETMRDELGAADRRFIDAVNVLVLIAFAVDYLVEVWLARPRRLFVRHEWTSAVIVAAQLVALVPELVGFGAIRVLRAAPLGRSVVLVLRAVAIGGAAATEGRLLLRRRAAAVALWSAALTWVTAAVGFTLVEDVGETGRLRSFFDALWWSSSTITTVGYGDVVPVTSAGRIVAVVTMVVGIASFSALTAKLAAVLLRPVTVDPAPSSPGSARRGTEGGSAVATPPFNRDDR